MIKWQKGEIMEEWKVTRITSDELDTIQAGGDLLLVHQNTVYGSTCILVEPVRLPYGLTDEEIITFCKEEAKII